MQRVRFQHCWPSCCFVSSGLTNSRKLARCISSEGSLGCVVCPLYHGICPTTSTPHPPPSDSCAPPLLCCCWCAPQHFPSVYVLASTVVIAALQSWHCLAFLYLGTYFAWLYLRFFQHQPETSIMGDPSEDFKFSSFFPAAAAGPIDAAAGVLGKVFRLRHDAHAEAKPLLPTAATGTLLGSNAVDANRRR